jgi:hypothetical protein
VSNSEPALHSLLSPRGVPWRGDAPYPAILPRRISRRVKHAQQGIGYPRLPRKRRVISALGSVGQWTLVVIVLSLALIGFLHLTRGTAVRHVRGVTADGAPISVSEPEFPLMATMATGAWLAPGNGVEILLNGDETYPRLWEDLRSAQRSITLQLYYGAPGRVADTLGAILRERAKAGFRCSFSTTPSVRWTFQRTIATRGGDENVDVREPVGGQFQDNRSACIELPKDQQTGRSSQRKNCAGNRVPR